MRPSSSGCRRARTSGCPWPGQPDQCTSAKLRRTLANMAQCGLPRMEGNEGVPLRFPRPSMAPVAVALVAVWVALNSAPALADQVRQSEWWLRELHITTAQQISQGSGVTIAVLDTGVDAAAPDLAGSVLTGPDFSHSGRTANGPFFGIHGTEIASIIAGHGHGSSEGLIGVA